MQRVAIAITIVLLVGTAAGPAGAEKTDVVVLANGDHITGEIKQLDRGRLGVKTDDMRTVSIQWDKIARITSRHVFEIERQDGQLYFGSLAEPEREGEAMIVLGRTSSNVPLIRIIRITPIESRFIERLGGGLKIGVSHTKSSGVTQFNGSGNVTYRTRQYALSLDARSVFTAQADEETKRDQQIKATTSRFLSQRWYSEGSISLQRNDELGINRRFLLVAGAGRRLIQSNQALFSLSGGLTFNQETSSDGTTTESLESVFKTAASLFRYDTPKTDLSAALDVFPGLTEWGRVRIELDTSASYEVISDFTVEVGFNDKYDSRSPTADAAKNDWSIVTSIGWEY